jgi:hypothetical protein
VADEPDDRPAPRDDEEPDPRAEVLEILAEMPLWSLPADRWDVVGKLLERIVRAERDGDDEALWAAVAELDVLSLERITDSLAEVPETHPAPRRIRPLRNRVIHQLGGVVPPDDRDQDAGRAEDADAPG